MIERVTWLNLTLKKLSSHFFSHSREKYVMLPLSFPDEHPSGL